MKKSIVKLIIFTLSIYNHNLFSQTLKTYSGDMQDAILDKGKATYTYYEKGTKIIKHGKFSYSWKDLQTIQVRDKKIDVSLIKTISGNYKDGLKDGVWNYSVKFTDYALKHAFSGDYSIPSDNTYSTGSIAMQSSYKSGVPNGNWSYTETFKTRYAIPKPYNTWVWSGYSKSNTITLKAQFIDGVLTGSFDYSNPYANESASFNFDHDGYIKENGIISKLGLEKKYTIINKKLVKEIHKDLSTSEIAIKEDFTNKINDPNFEHKIDTISFSDNLNSIMNVFRNNYYFNYRKPSGNEPLIGGDNFYKYKRAIDGAFVLNITEALPIYLVKCNGRPITEKEKTAFSYWDKGNYKMAKEFLLEMESCVKSTFIKKSEKEPTLKSIQANIRELDSLMSSNEKITLEGYHKLFYSQYHQIESKANQEVIGIKLGSDQLNLIYTHNSIEVKAKIIVNFPENSSTQISLTNMCLTIYDNNDKLLTMIRPVNSTPTKWLTNGEYELVFRKEFNTTGLNTLQSYKQKGMKSFSIDVGNRICK